MKIVIIVGILAFFLFPLSPVSFAQETQEDIILPTQELSTSQSAAMQEDEAASSYVLPYPGLLPDSPLYILKTFRDHMIGFLISDPTKQAEFNLLQADKRLQAGLYLYQKHNGKEQLAFTTFDKGENYFEQAIAKLRASKQQGIGNGEVIKKVYESAQKHESVYQDLLKTSPKKYAPQFKALAQRAENYEKQVKTLMPKTKK